MSDEMKSANILTENGESVLVKNKVKRGFAAHPENINRAGRKKNIFKDRIKQMMKDRTRPYWLTDKEWDSMSLFEQEEVAIARSEQLVLRIYDYAMEGKKGAMEAAKTLIEHADGKAKQQVSVLTGGLEDDLRNLTPQELDELERGYLKNLNQHPEQLEYNGNDNDF